VNEIFRASRGVDENLHPKGGRRNSPPSRGGVDEISEPEGVGSRNLLGPKGG